MNNWIFNILKKATQLKAEENAEEQDKQVQNDMFKDVMAIDEKELKQEADTQQAGMEEAHGYKKEADLQLIMEEAGAIFTVKANTPEEAQKFYISLMENGHFVLEELDFFEGRSEIYVKVSDNVDYNRNILEKAIDYSNVLGKSKSRSEGTLRLTLSRVNKEAAFNLGDTEAETVKLDYKLEISGLSDYNIAEMLAEAETHDKQSTTVNFNEEKEKQLKSVKSDRSAAETKVFNLVKDHTLEDWKKAFQNMSKYEHKVATEEELRGKDWKKGDWRTNDKDFKAVSDDDKEKDMEGVGTEEEKGQVGVTASLLIGKSVRHKKTGKIGVIISL